MRIFNVVLVMLVFVSHDLQSCELSDEFLKARKEVREMVYGDDNDYRRCQNSVHNYEFWKAMAKCTEDGDGRNVGGGCVHLVGGSKYLNTPNTNHCKVFKFKPTAKIAQELLEEMVEQKNIMKCKH